MRPTTRSPQARRGLHRAGIRNAATAPAAQRMKNAEKSRAVVLMPAPLMCLGGSEVDGDGGFRSTTSKQRMEDCQRRRRAARNHDVNREDFRDAARSGEARSEDAAENRASADRHDPLRLGHGLVGLAQGQPHCVRDRARRPAGHRRCAASAS